jgi:hypothetical protein
MTSEWGLDADVDATIKAHEEDGDGWCAGEHEVPEPYPCQTRLWMEDLAEKNRRAASAPRRAISHDLESNKVILRWGALSRSIGGEDLDVMNGVTLRAGFEGREVTPEEIWAALDEAEVFRRHVAQLAANRRI